MITVILSWIILLVVFLAFGEIATTIWNTATKQNNSYSITDKFWIGICLVGILLLYISIFAPINIWLLAVFFITSLSYVVIKRAVFIAQIKTVVRQIKEISTLYKLIAVLTFSSILIYALCVPTIYDEGLYHLQSMIWAESYPTVVGLGNLHGRLAFNSSFLLLSTLFNYHPSHYYTAFTINGLCLLVFSFWIICRVVKSTSMIDKIALSLILMLSIFSLAPSISSTSTDILPNIFVMYLLLKWVFSLRQEKESRFFFDKFLLIALMAIFCVTLKLSSTIILLVFLIPFAGASFKRNKKHILYILVIGFIVAIPWCTRFIILSGYLVYPFPAIDIFSFDWKMPIEMVITEKEAAYAWARIPNKNIAEVANMSIVEWLPTWINRMSWYVITIYSLALISPILIGILLKKIKNKASILIWVVAYFGVLFNLFTAPDLRFAYGFLISTIFIPIFIVSPYFLEEERKAKKIIPYNKVFAIVLILGLFGLNRIAIRSVEFYNRHAARTTIGLLYKPSPIDGAQKKAEITYQEYNLNDVTLYVPLENDLCIDQPIPCAPHYNNNLEMRGENIENGFRIKK